MRVVSINNNPKFNTLNVNKPKKTDYVNSKYLTFTANLKPKALPNQTPSKFKQFFKKTNRFLTILMFAYASIFLPQKYNSIAKDLGFVEPQQENFETKEEALKYAINKIREPLNQEKPYEYSVILDYKDYSVVSERKGNERSVANYTIGYALKDFLGIKHPFIMLHGHPADVMENKTATQTFSFQDFRAFNNNVNEKESYVVNKEGQFCVFRKKDNYKQLSEDELKKLREDYDFFYRAAWANLVKINKDGQTLHQFHDYQGMHAFWQDMANKYNFEYYTNYGTFDGIDAYRDYYYPEMEPPQSPTGHKYFKI